MKGQKFSQDKLPLGTMILTQFPKALMEVARCTAAGHQKYNKNQEDEDWLNFSRVENPKFQYTNAALRHLMEAETHTFNEDMKEYDPKVRHLAQSAWNLLCRLEVELREDVEYIEDATKIPPYKKNYWDKMKSEYEDMATGVLQALRNYEHKLWESDVSPHVKDFDKLLIIPRLSINELLDSNKENEDYFPDSLV